MNSDAVLRVSRIGSHDLLTVIDRRHANLCLGLWWCQRLADLPDFSTDTAATTDYTGFASGAPCRKLTINQEDHILNGWDLNRIFNGSGIRNAGEDPAAAPTIAAGGGTGLTGAYTAVYTYYDATTGYETNATASAPSTITLANQSLAVTVQASTNTRFTNIRIYRNAAGVPATYKLDTETTNTAQTVQLSKADASLGATIETTNYRPPVAMFIAKTKSRVFWAGARTWSEGTVTVTNGSPTITFTVEPPQNLYTRHANAPFYISIDNGLRYQVSALSGTTGTLSANYQGTSNSGLSYTLCGLKNRVWYCDIDDNGLVKPESWNSSNYFNIGLEGDSPGNNYPDEITALREFGNKLYIWTKKSIFFFDPLISQTKRTPAAMGTICDKTICEDKDGNLVFIGGDNQAYAFAGSNVVPISAEVRNRMGDKNRYNLNLDEYSFSYYDRKEGIHAFNRPYYSATLDAMRYIVDTYDDVRGMWGERVAPRITAVCTIRDKTQEIIIGVDTLGLVQQIDSYDTSSTFGSDSFTLTTPTVSTSVAGEISPGTASRGKVAVLFSTTAVKGSKLIIDTATASAATEDLFDSVTAAAGDLYIIGAWHGTYETGWLDFGYPDLYKRTHFISGQFVGGSSGYLFVTWYADQSSTSRGSLRIYANSEPDFKRVIPCRGRLIKFKFEAVTELVGLALRELHIGYHLQGDV